MPFSPHVLITLLAFASCAVADPTDWVNIDYVCKQPQSSSTKDAQNAIIQSARSSAAKGPWSVTNSKKVNPPSGDPHDYLSWAPYHWPNCNWCATGSNGRVHLVHDGNRTDDSGSTSDNGDDDVYQDEAVQSPDEMSEFPVARHRMSRRRRRTDDVIEPSEGPQAPLGALPSTVSLSSLYLSTSPTKTTATAVAGTSAPPQAAAKTSSCTPSPTKPMPPSATWTTCPYAVRDGKVNPDVRTLNGPAAINSASQSILYNAIGFALTGNPTYSNNAVNFTRAFFLNASTRMSPNMNFGQVVRGPGKTGQEGTFTGLLDLRGFAKIVNAICILKAAASPDWTNATDQDMYKWTDEYVRWLTNSSLGESTASKANNHRTFYAVQMVTARMLLGDNAGAISHLEGFFTDQFLDQIAASGEQPLEAVRTRPWHYRCFNMEALITLCKLGDYLGRDFWTAKSRYRATIQTAVDFLIQLDPKGEDVTEAVPHVAAVAAAYGDPDGKYAAFTKKAMSDYWTQPFYYYNQPEAFTQAPSVQRHKREESRDTTLAGTVPFKCPIQEIVNGEKVVVLDDDVWVKCAELEPLYMNKTLEDNIPV